MKQLIFNLALVVLGFSYSGFSINQKDPDVAGQESYSITEEYDVINEVTNVKFIIPLNSFVKVTVNDHYSGIETILAEGEMGKGEYVIHYKNNTNTNSDKNSFRLEGYSILDHSLKYSSITN